MWKFVLVGIVALVLATFCAAALPEKTYKNPVLDGAPGSSLLYDPKSKAYYVVMTGAFPEPGKGMFRIFKSLNLIDWELKSYAFPHRHYPKWAIVDHGWTGPEMRFYNGKYVLIYTAGCHGKKGRQVMTDKDHIQCIGVAFANNPLGPYKDSGKPLMQKDYWTNWDASMFKDPKTGKAYLYWKAIDTRGGSRGWLYGRELSRDLTSLRRHKWPGEELLVKEEKWEGADKTGALEAGFTFYRAPYYYIIYSAGGWESKDCGYAIGVVRAKHPLGPFHRTKKNPIVHKSAAWCNPGVPSVSPLRSDSKRTVMFYSAMKGTKGGRGVQRWGLVDELLWKDGWPYLPKNIPSSWSCPIPDRF